MSPHARSDTPRFEVAMKARMYHGALYKAQKELGFTQGEMAECLDIHQGQYGALLRMEWVPDFSKENWKPLQHKLEALTDQTIGELFPGYVFTKEFLKKDKTVEVTRDVSPLLLSNAATVHQLSFTPAEEAMYREESLTSAESGMREAFEKAMVHLNPREQRVIIGRFFEDKTLKDLGKEFCVGMERIRQIEACALRRLRGPRSTHILIRYWNPSMIRDPFREKMMAALEKSTILHAR